MAEETRLGRVLSSINTEPKSIVLAKCLSGTDFLTPADIRDEYAKWADWPTESINFYEYCHFSFGPLGMALKHEQEKSWLSSEEGIEYGRPIASHAIKAACELGISLYSILGQSQSSGTTNSPSNAFKVLQALGKGRGQLEHVADYAGVPMESARNALLRMQEAGLVSYDSVSSHTQGWAKYTWKSGKKPEDVPKYGYEPGFTKLVTEALHKLGSADGADIYGVIGKRKEEICKILTHLARNGFAESKWKDRVQSKIEMKEKGWQALRLLYSIEEACSDSKVLAMMGKRMNSVGRDETSRAAELYRQVAPPALSNYRSHATARLMDFIKGYEDANGCGPRSRDIMTSLGLGYTRHLTRLVRNGDLASERDGHKVRYRIARKE